MTQRKYRLSSSTGRYLTGRLNDGRQVLMGVLCPHYECYFFDAEGHFAQVETRQLSVPPSIRNGVYHFDEQAESSLQRDIAIWKVELSFVESAIEIFRFESTDAAGWHCRTVKFFGRTRECRQTRTQMVC